MQGLQGTASVLPFGKHGCLEQSVPAGAPGPLAGGDEKQVCSASGLLGLRAAQGSQRPGRPSPTQSPPPEQLPTHLCTRGAFL